jgi:hypothetical protein
MRIVVLCVFVHSLLAFSSDLEISQDSYQSLLNDCKTSILENIEAYIIILPSELGCYFCRCAHSFLSSNKYLHVKKRQLQLENLKSILKTNKFCPIDIHQYLNVEMIPFNGEYGQKFLESCNRKLENFIKIFKQKISNNESKNLIKCLLCKQHSAHMKYKCNHMLTCKTCEDSRLYHICLDCNKETLSNEIEILFEYFVKMPECSICYNKDICLSILSPCGHSYCAECSKKFKDCPQCRSQITNVQFIELSKYNEICSICNKAKSDLLYIDCGHLITCFDCVKMLSCADCAKCNNKSSDNISIRIFN